MKNVFSGWKGHRIEKRAQRKPAHEVNDRPGTGVKGLFGIYLFPTIPSAAAAKSSSVNLSGFRGHIPAALNPGRAW